MPDDLDNIGLPKELSQTQVLGKFASDPDAETLHTQLKEYFADGSLKVYKRDRNLLTLVDFCQKQRNSFPLVDKHTRMVFVVSGGHHAEVMAALYYMLKSKQVKRKIGWSDTGRSIDTAGDKYIKEGFGYYFSAAMKEGRGYSGFHLIYGADYKRDRIDEAIFETYKKGAQMLGIPREIREDPEMRAAQARVEQELLDRQKKEEDKS